MKKIISWLLACCLILCATGCKKDTPAATPTESNVSDITIEPIILDAPFLAVGLPAINNQVAHQDGTCIFTSNQPYMTLTMDGQATAELIINDFMNRVSNSMGTAEALKDAAAAAYETNPTNWVPYSVEINYTPARIDPNVLSLFGIITTYSGGSHPDYTCVSASYNMISGDPLTLGSILTHESAIPSLRDLLIRQLEAQAEEKFLRENFQEDIKQRFANDVSFDEDWYFSATGLCFYFAPYQIAPYSSGIIEAVIPYSDLVGIIEDAYFPAESSINNGSAKVLPFTMDAASGYKQTSELILDMDGEKFLVEADSCIQNIRIVQTRTQTGRNDSVVSACYMAYCLNPGNAIMVQRAPSNEYLYSVQYLQNGNIINIPITQE